MSELERSKFFVTVHNCRLCGCIIPTAEGVRRHQLVRRVSGDFPHDMFQQMSLAKFPSPLVTLKKIPLRCLDQDKECSKSGQDMIMASSSPPQDRHRRQSSLRALDIMSRYLQRNSSEEKDATGNEKLSAKKINANVTRNKRTKIRQNHDKKNAWGNSFVRKNKVSEETNKFVCPVKGCGTRLKRPYQLKLHFIMHLENNPFACPVPGCQIKCGTHFHFNRHINWHMGTNILSCEECGQKCADSTRLKKHLSKCKAKRHYQRDNIITLEQMSKILKSHYANLESRGLLLDDKVLPDDDKFKDDKLGILKFHRRIIMDMIIERDPVFLQVSHENPELKDNLFRRKPKGGVKPGIPKQFKCSKCDKSYQTLEGLNDHFNFNHRNRPYKCSRCGRNYIDKGHLVAHLKEHELTGNDIYMKQLKNGHFKCTKCDFESAYKFSSSMRRHWFLVHNVTIPIRQNIIEEKKTKKIRKNSVKEFKYKCSDCGESYENVRSLSEHYNSTHRERPHKCSLCGQEFLKEAHFKVHMNYHQVLTGNKIYMKRLPNGNLQCTKCQFESISKHGHHMRRHWLSVHNVTIPSRHGHKLNEKDKKTSFRTVGNIKGGFDFEPEEDSQPIIKIESQPALQLSIIFAGDDDVKPVQVQSVKMEPQGVNQD